MESKLDQIELPIYTPNESRVNTLLSLGMDLSEDDLYIIELDMLSKLESGEELDLLEYITLKYPKWKSNSKLVELMSNH